MPFTAQLVPTPSESNTRSDKTYLTSVWSVRLGVVDLFYASFFQQRLKCASQIQVNTS